jgi:hypothetical protein
LGKELVRGGFELLTHGFFGGRCSRRRLVGEGFSEGRFRAKGRLSFGFWQDYKIRNRIIG